MFFLVALRQQFKIINYFYLLFHKFFSNDVWFFLLHCVIPNAALLRTHLLRRMFRDLTFIFSKGVLNLFYYFFVFTFFIKIITTSSKGRETARSPKPAVSLPLNPTLLGHGLGLCPKNLHASKWVALAANKSVCFFKRCLIFFEGRATRICSGLTPFARICLWRHGNGR